MDDGWLLGHIMETWVGRGGEERREAQSDTEDFTWEKEGGSLRECDSYRKLTY